MKLFDVNRIWNEWREDFLLSMRKNAHVVVLGRIDMIRESNRTFASKRGIIDHDFSSAPDIQTDRTERHLNWIFVRFGHRRGPFCTDYDIFLVRFTHMVTYALQLSTKRLEALFFFSSSSLFNKHPTTVFFFQKIFIWDFCSIENDIDLE